jgi:hypothetical protein
MISVYGTTFARVSEITRHWKPKNVIPGGDFASITAYWTPNSAMVIAVVG